jgi:hypothetical protein
MQPPDTHHFIAWSTSCSSHLLADLFKHKGSQLLLYQLAIMPLEEIGAFVTVLPLGHELLHGRLTALCPPERIMMSHIILWATKF